MEISEAVKNSLNIIDIISEQVKLRKTGADYVGLCPFHEEKTPSFHVSEEKQSYYCFGCNRGGDIFTFLMETEKLDFRQALEILSRRAGIEIKNNKEQKTLKDNYEILETVGKIFSDIILNKPEGELAREYLKRRNLNKDDCVRFSLGYSPNSWDYITRALRNSGVPDKKIISSGLAIQNSNGNIYDRFRGRIMFPIKDLSGRIIAFGGRIIDGDGAKYINSPESEIYSKRKNLYLLNEARKSMKNKRAILVEGYMDAVRLHKKGLTETVASLGTSLTPEQAEMLSKFADTCYICYDSDLAGQEAAIKGMYILQEQGLDVRVTEIPEGKDPDEYLNNRKKEDFENLLSLSKPLIIKHLESLKEQFQTPGQFRKAERELLEGLSKLRLPEIEHYKNNICTTLGITLKELKTKITEFKKNKPSQIHDEDNVNVNETFNKNIKTNPIEAAMLALIWKYSELRNRLTADDILKLLEDSEIITAALGIMTYGSEEMTNRWRLTQEFGIIATLSEGEEYLNQIQKNPNENITPENQWQKLVSLMNLYRANNEIAKIKKRLLYGEADNNDFQDYEKNFHIRDSLL